MISFDNFWHDYQYDVISVIGYVMVCNNTYEHIVKRKTLKFDQNSLLDAVKKIQCEINNTYVKENMDYWRLRKQCLGKVIMILAIFSLRYAYNKGIS